VEKWQHRILMCAIQCLSIQPWEGVSRAERQLSDQERRGLRCITAVYPAIEPSSHFSAALVGLGAARRYNQYTRVVRVGERPKGKSVRAILPPPEAGQHPGGATSAGVACVRILGD